MGHHAMGTSAIQQFVGIFPHPLAVASGIIFLVEDSFSPSYSNWLGAQVVPFYRSRGHLLGNFLDFPLRLQHRFLHNPRQQRCKNWPFAPSDAWSAEYAPASALTAFGCESRPTGNGETRQFVTLPTRDSGMIFKSRKLWIWRMVFCQPRNLPTCCNLVIEFPYHIIWDDVTCPILRPSASPSSWKKNGSKKFVKTGEEHIPKSWCEMKWST